MLAEYNEMCEEEEDLALEAGTVISLQCEDRDSPGWWRATLGGHQEVLVRVRRDNRRR